MDVPPSTVKLTPAGNDAGLPKFTHLSKLALVGKMWAMAVIVSVLSVVST